MPLFYFKLLNDHSVADNDGTELPDAEAARSHAFAVAAELVANGSAGMLGCSWQHWTMAVADEKGREVFSFSMADAQGTPARATGASTH